MGGRCFSSVDDLEEGSVERAEPHVLIVVVCLIGALLLMDYWVISGWTSDDGSQYLESWAPSAQR